MADTTNKYNFLDYEGLALFWNNVKNVIEDNELITASALTNLNTRVDTVEGSATGQMISMIYLELKTLRNANSLVTGQQYRNINYDTIVNEEDTGYKSAHHQFDIIVKQI